MTDAAVRFADHQGLLRLFAQGFAARFVNFTLLPDEGWQSMQESGDGIHLPAAIEYFSLQRHNLGAYRIAVLHQAAYFTEGTRAFDWQSVARETLHPALFARIYMLLENRRIDVLTARRYPGARHDLQRVLAHALACRPQDFPTAAPAWLLEALQRFSLGAARATLLREDRAGLLRAAFDLADVVEPGAATAADSAAAARGICALLSAWLKTPADAALTGSTAAPLPPSLHAGPASPAEPATGLDDAAFGLGEPLDFRGELEPAASLSERAGGQFGAMPAGNSHFPPAVIAPLRRATRFSMARTATRSFLYDEWDFQQQVYLKTWCRVHEQRLRGESGGFLHEVRRRHGHLLNRVRRQFGRIKPDSLQRVSRTSDGDELELEALIEAVIDRRAGFTIDSRLYVRRDRLQRDVAAAFLVYMSASTDIALPAADPDLKTTPPTASGETGYYFYSAAEETQAASGPPKRRVIDVAKEALALMCEALHALGDRFAIYGFSGDGRDYVEFNVVKEFRDALSPRTWGALGAMEPKRSTRMGAAIRHAITKLRHEAAALKVLLIISDGYPEDSDYGPDRNDHEYGIQDTAQALLEAQRAGIVAFCVTIDPSGHDYLKRMCNESRYLIIEDVPDLPQALTKVYRALTA